MKNAIPFAGVAVLALLLWNADVEGRGFGGYRGGYGGYHYGGYGGYRAGGYRGYSENYGGYRNNGYRTSYSGYRNEYSGWRGSGAASSYDRSYSGARGTSVNVEGNRFAGAGPYGAAVAGRREVSATGPEGRTYTGYRQGGAAVGPYGRMVGGGSRAGVATGPGGVVAGGSRAGFAGTRFPTDFGLANYSAYRVGGVGHSTAFWSHGYMTTHAGYVRSGFGYYHCFSPVWYTAHPGAWLPAGWAARSAWLAASWAALYAWCSFSAAPEYYDYGNTIVYQNNNVYLDGESVGSAQDYAQQAITLAVQGQTASPPPEQEWKALGVFALVQGQEKTSNNLFQLAIDKEGVIRGNYYDGLMDTTTPVFGSVNKRTQRAAWTIGKKKDRVFETGIYNLTKEETPILVHFGTERTQQWLLVRMENPK